MKATKVKILVLLGLILISTLSGCWYLAHQDETLGLKTQAQIIKEISPQEAETLIKNYTDSGNFTIIDVRTPGEFASGHLPQAINLDFRSQTFNEKLAKLDKGVPYLVYCQSGNRSQKVLDIMRELGFRQVYGISGGIAQWSVEGLPIVK